MRPLLTPEEMGRADAATIEAGTMAEILMERAGRAVARAVLRIAQHRYGARVAIVCGSGNNGGDGFVAALVLQREGVGVRCLTVGEAGDRGAAGHHAEAARASGVRIDPFTAGALEDCDVIVDALFGTGFRPPARGEASAAIEAVNAAGAPVVSVDIPSGIHGATGAAEGACVRATTTVAMGAEKLGTALAPGAAHAGYVEVVDIGIALPEARAQTVERADVAAVLPRRAPEAHKRSVGSVVLFAGSSDLTGAALLTASGALRAGAGYVTLAATPRVKSAAATLPEVLCPVVTDADVLGPGVLGVLEEALAGARAIGIGPGLGTGEEQRMLVDEVLAKVEAPVVVDADGLNALAGRSGALEARSGTTLITPHPGELARLLDVSTGEIQSSRLDAARRAAERFACVVLLKGYRTVVARPDGWAYVDPMGGPELATAGTGDVLTGAIASLLAQGLKPDEAAWAGAFVHGLAGRVAGAGRGGIGVTAVDVAEALPEAVSLILDGS